MSKQMTDLYDKVSRERRLWGMTLPVRHANAFKDLLLTLNTFASVATFLAAVQAQVIALPLESDSIGLQTAAQSFFFAGLFFDVFGGCVSLIGIIQLQNLHTILRRRTTAVSAIIHTLESLETAEDDFCVYLQYSEVVLLRILGNIGGWNRCLQTFARLSGESMDGLGKQQRKRVRIHVLEYEATTTDLQSLRMGSKRFGASLAFFAYASVPVIVFSGVACFILGGLCFVKSAQPNAVWITSFAAVGSLVIIAIGMITRGAWTQGNTLHR